jgi:CRP-like cAMP-binding protein
MKTMLRPDTTHSAAETLSTVPYFVELAPECPVTIEALARGAIRRDYDQGQVVFLEGEPCLGLYMVQAGWFKSVKMTPAGREQVGAFRRAGGSL